MPSSCVGSDRYMNQTLVDKRFPASKRSKDNKRKEVSRNLKQGKHEHQPFFCRKEKQTQDSEEKRVPIIIQQKREEKYEYHPSLFRREKQTQDREEIPIEKLPTFPPQEYPFLVRIEPELHWKLSPLTCSLSLIPGNPKFLEDLPRARVPWILRTRPNLKG